MSDPVYLVDATAFIFRGYYGSQPMSAADGTPTHAAFGFTNLLLKLVREKKPQALCLVYDAGAVTFRNRLYPAYKANRGPAPEDLVPQFELCVEVGRSLGIPTACVPDFEADDVLATLALACEAAGREVVVVTGDKDLAQLVTARVRLLDFIKDTIMDEAAVLSRFGVPPSRVPDWLALVGDASDNIPGVRGIGASGASALLSRFDGLDAVYRDLAAVERAPIRRPAFVARSLEEGRETAFLARELATVRRDVPLELGAGDLAWSGAAPGGAYGAVFARLGFEWLARRVPTAP